MTSAPPVERTRVAHFTVPGEPVSKARARFTGYGSKVRTYTPANVVAAERKIAASYSASHSLINDTDLAFGVEVEFLHQTGQRRDVDNMLKAVLDALNGVAWPDDVQVTSIHATKRRVPKGEAETRVTLYTLGRVDKPRGRCEHCGGEFTFYASQSARRFCTQTCHIEWRRVRRERTCAHCGREFDHAHPSHGARFCSKECAQTSTHAEVVCASCAGTFTRARSLNRSGNAYCSPECKATYWRDHRKSAAKGVCGDCGEATTKKTYKRCRDCNYKAGGRWASVEDAP